MCRNGYLWQYLGSVFRHTYIKLECGVGQLSWFRLLTSSAFIQGYASLLRPQFSLVVVFTKVWQCVAVHTLTILCSVLLQYGSDEFGQDSPRYTSPKTAGLYGDSYYIGEYWYCTQTSCGIIPCSVSTLEHILKWLGKGRSRGREGTDWIVSVSVLFEAQESIGGGSDIWQGQAYFLRMPVVGWSVIRLMPVTTSPILCRPEYGSGSGL